VLAEWILQPRQCKSSRLGIILGAVKRQKKVAVLRGIKKVPWDGLSNRAV